MMQMQYTYLRRAAAGRRGQDRHARAAGWRTSARWAATLAFVVLRDFYGTTQVVVETEDDDERSSRA